MAGFQCCAEEFPHKAIPTLSLPVQETLLSLHGADGSDVLADFGAAQIPAIVSDREIADVDEASAQFDACSLKGNFEPNYRHEFS